MKDALCIVVYTNANWEHALAWLRYRAPVAALGWKIVRGNDWETVYPERVAQADIVLVQRGFPQNMEAFDTVLNLAREQGKPLVYDIDDWLPEIPPEHPAYDAHLEQWLTAFLGVFSADVVLVSSRQLQENFALFHPQVWLVPNGLPDTFWQVRPPSKPKPQETVVMGYMGTATHLNDLRAIEGVLLRLLEARPELHLDVWGCPLPEVLKQHPRAQTISPELHAYPEFAAYFSRQTADFWIAPLLDTPFNRAKSPIKFWEYTATGAPGVYQAMPPYSDVVVHQENGLLADTPEAWYDACLYLIDHPEERYHLALKAHETLQKRGMLSSLSKIWEQTYRRTLNYAGTRPDTLTREQRILLETLRRAQQRAWKRHLDTMRLVEDLRTSERALQETRQAYQDILQSRSWRFMRRIQRVREALIPPGGKSERCIKTVFRALRAWKRDGTRFTVQRVFFVAQRAVSSRWFRWRYRRGGKLFWLVDPIRPPRSLTERTASVDIIVCVHNALDDVRRCLESVVRYTTSPYTLILVDDGSDAPVQEYLRRFAETQGVTLLRNERARGYTRAANQGLRASMGDYALLLNSDTVVTPGWLDGMVACAVSDERIGLVGPLSNTASWQSVPKTLNEQGDWAANALPEGVDIAEMAARIRRASARLYPRIPFLNGFCLMIRRQVLDTVGYFDEETFGAGYGEENDYCLRARQAGWELAVADDVYVYHAQSKSYSHERRRQLALRADEKLAAKHGQPRITQGVRLCRENPVLAGIRARAEVMHSRADLLRRGLERWEGRRVLFVLPVLRATGGGHVIVQEAKAMRRMGVDAHILNLRPHEVTFTREYPESDLPVIYVDEQRLPAEVLRAYDAFIATVYHTVRWLEPVRHAVRGYYIQDFEPWFFEPGTPEHKAARQSYSYFDGLVRVTKTAWNARMVQEQAGVLAHVVGPSLDIELFRPRPSQGPQWPQRPLRIAAMVRPSTPRRQPQFTVDVLKEFSLRRKNDVEIVFFGCDPGDPEFQQWAKGFSWRHAGVLTRQQLARLFNEVDIFLDASAFQAMGLTAMEAMACGVSVIVPRDGGVDSFAVHERNALIVDTGSRQAVLDALTRLVDDHTLRTHLRQNAIWDICAYTPEQAAFRLLEALFGEPF